jgi:8-oxo-dGTP diphosphatase
VADVTPARQDLREAAKLDSAVNSSRRYPVRPVVGVGALIFDESRILLVERGQHPLKGQWSLPGGGVETGESLEQAIIREVREETGLDVHPVEVGAIFERILRDVNDAPEYHYVLIDFICEVIGGSLCAGHDSCCAKWFEISGLEQLNMTEGTLAVIRRVHRDGPSLTLMRP